MKTINHIRSIAALIAPFIIGITIILAPVLVFSNLSYSYANSKSIVFEIGFAVIILLGLLIIPWKSFKQALTSKIVLALGVFLVVSIIASIASIDPTLSWLSHLERGTGMFFILVVACGAFFSILITYQTNTLRKAILYPVTIASGILGLSTIIGVTGFNIGHFQVLSDVSGGGGLTGNSSFAGTFFILAFFVIAYLFLTTKSVWKKVVLAIIAFVTVINPVLFGYAAILRGGFHGAISIIGDARGAAISLILGVLVSIGIYLSYAQKSTWKWAGKILTALILAITLGSIVLLVVPNTPVNRFFVSNTSGARFLYWDIALQSAKAHPILGTGPETFRYAHQYYFNPDFMRKSFLRELYADKPHNAYLEILVSTGIVGCVAYLALLIALIWTLVRLAKRKENKVLVAAIAGFLFAYLLNNLILFDTTISYPLFFFGIFWLALEERRQSGVLLQNTISSSTPYYFFGRLIAGVGIVVLILSIVIPEVTKLRYVLQEMYAPLSQRIGDYQRSESASAYGSGITLAQRVDVYTQNYLTHLDQVSAADALSQKEVFEDVDAMTQAINVSVAKFPKNAQSFIDLGRLGSIKIALENKVDEAAITQMINAGEEVKKLSPRNPQAYWIIGQALTYEGKFQDALTVFEQGIAIDPHVPESQETVIHLAQIIGDKNLYAKAMADYNANVIPADRD